MKSSTSFRFSSLWFFFFIVASMAVSVYSDDDCEYSFYVRTGSVANAGTDSRIDVTLVNSVGERLDFPDLKKWGKMKPGHDYFKRGNFDYFSGTSGCFDAPIRYVCMINVTSDGSGQNPGWFLEFVRVVILDLRDSDYHSLPTVIKFEFSQWLAKYEPPYKLTASRDLCKSRTSF